LIKNDVSDKNPLEAVYPQTLSDLTIQNTGHGWKVDIPDELAVKTCKLALNRKNFPQIKLTVP